MTGRCLLNPRLSLLLLLLVSERVDAFVTPATTTRTPVNTRTTTTTTARHLSFWQDLLGKAFENDANILSKSDKRTGSIDEGVIDYNDNVNGRNRVGKNYDNFGQPRTTPTQQQWRQAMTAVTGRLLQEQQSKWTLDLYLTGIPNKDPSNDLYGSRVNISTRDRKIGLTVPDQPTVANVYIEFLPNQQLRVREDSAAAAATGFVKVPDDDNSDDDKDDSGYSRGDWILSPNGQNIRFRFPVTGFTRTVETKGTIQKVFWSQEPAAISQTSTTYNIPAGWLYGEATVRVGGGTSSTSRSIQWEDCLLKVEQSVGLLGAATKMIPCGRFTATPQRGE